MSQTLKTQEESRDELRERLSSAVSGLQQLSPRAEPVGGPHEDGHREAETALTRRPGTSRKLALIILIVASNMVQVGHTAALRYICSYDF